MEWKETYNRHLDMEDGDLFVARVDKQYSHAGFMLGVFKGGIMWDAKVLDDNMLWQEEWTQLDDVSYEYAKVGVNVFKEKKLIN